MVTKTVCKKGKKFVQDTGFVDINQSTSTYPFNLGDDNEVQFKMLTSLIKDKIDKHGDEGILTIVLPFKHNKQVKLCFVRVCETETHKENSSIVIIPNLNKGWAKARSALDSNISKYAHKATGSAEMIMPNNTFRLTTAVKPGKS